MIEKEVDLFGWLETNLEWNNYTFQHECYKMIRQHIPGGAWKPTTSKISMESNKKHGGNLMVMNKKLRARAQVFKKDRMGRWVWTVFQGKHKPILIVQLYIPASNQGLFSTYVQQFQQLQQETGEAAPKVYDTYFQDLQILLSQYGESHKVLMGDYNRTTDDEEIAFLQAEYDLRDAYADLHDHNQFPTHQRGSKRIDYILVSAELMKHVN